MEALTDAQQKEVSKLSAIVKRCQEQLELAQKNIQDKGLSYVQERINTKFQNTKKKLEKLEAISVEEEKQRLEEECNAKISALREEYRNKLLTFEQEREEKIKEYESILTTCESQLYKESPLVIDARNRLEIAKKNLDGYVQQCVRFYEIQEPPASSSNPFQRLREIQERREAQEREERRKEAERDIRERERKEEEQKERDREIARKARLAQEEKDRIRQDKQRLEELETQTLSSRRSSVSVDSWDITGMSEESIVRFLESKQRAQAVIPPHLLHYLQKSEPPPAKPKKGVKLCRSVVKTIGSGVSTYQQPLDD